MSHQLRAGIGTLIMIIIAVNSFAATPVNFCRNASLLDITDRGSVTNTPCVLSPKAVLWETGYQYKNSTPAGSLQNVPQATFYLGLPANTEFAVVLPTYILQSNPRFSGATATMVGIKHEITYGTNWVAAGELFITPSSGSAGFGSQGYGVLVNGMASYKITANATMTLMLGESTATDTNLAGGKRFNSFNPSVAAAYSLSEKTNVFVEFFGQTKTDPRLAGNYNVDCGFLYVLTPNIVLDFEVGQQLNHQISFNQFVGAGVSLKL